MTEKIIHSFEAGRRGKPDELDSNIAHLIGSHLLKKDSNARFDLRVAGGYDSQAQKPKIRISGEVNQALRKSMKEIGKLNCIGMDLAPMESWKIHFREKIPANFLEREHF